LRRPSAFEINLRTGLIPAGHSEPVELKFNPWHDPDDGRFTFSGQGSYFRGPGASMAPEKSSSSTDPTTERSDLLRLAQFRPNPRARMGGNGGPPLYDPRTLEDAFPGLSRAPGGVVLSLADNFLDFTGPARAWTRELAVRHAKTLVQQIKALQPNYELNLLEPGGFPASADGQVNLINRPVSIAQRRFTARANLDHFKSKRCDSCNPRWIPRTKRACDCSGVVGFRFGCRNVRPSVISLIFELGRN